MTSNVTIIGNLKMHPVKAVLERYQKLVKGEEFGLLVPYPYLMMAKKMLPTLWIGAQGMSEYDKGAYTSEVSALMLQDIGIQTVMIGHSEVRARGVDVKKQLEIAKNLGLQIIYCIGENREVFEKEGTEDWLTEQLSVLSDYDNMMIAYEPIWSIGSGNLPSYDDINQGIKVVKEWLRANITGNSGSIRVLYGGSIDNKNCESVLSHTNVDGFLIGKTSLEPELMLEVVERCK